MWHPVRSTSYSCNGTQQEQIHQKTYSAPHLGQFVVPTELLHATTRLGQTAPSRRSPRARPGLILPVIASATERGKPLHAASASAHRARWAQDIRESNPDQSLSTNCFAWQRGSGDSGPQMIFLMYFLIHIYLNGAQARNSGDERTGRVFLHIWIWADQSLDAPSFQVARGAVSGDLTSSLSHSLHRPLAPHFEEHNTGLAIRLLLQDGQATYFPNG